MCEFYDSYLQCFSGSGQRGNWALKPKSGGVTVQAKKKSQASTAGAVVALCH